MKLIAWCCMAVALAACTQLAAQAETSETRFSVAVRMVEVSASVFDHKGVPVIGLGRERFSVYDNGERQDLDYFQETTAPVSCALLLDTTGSMEQQLPLLKKVVNQFIDGLRSDDEVAVYQFTATLNLRQDFTTDKREAKQAVMALRTQGQTALFDALAQVVHQMSGRPGKKAIVLFTDGDDNASSLNARRAIAGAKEAGIPVYAVAFGEASRSKALLSVLEDIAGSTGARALAVRDHKKLARAFEDLLSNVSHTYMLAYEVPPAAGEGWREIRVDVEGLKRARIRAREGYQP
jgi:Ca-activated chloride channel homolog